MGRLASSVRRFLPVAHLSLATAHGGTAVSVLQPASLTAPVSVRPARVPPPPWREGLGERSTLTSSVLLGLLAAGALLLAIAGKYTAALAGAALVGQWALSSGWWRAERRRPAFAFLGALLGPVLVLGVLAVGAAFALTGETPILFRFGNLSERLGEDWLALPMWIGLRGLLFSPGKSVFLYSPWLLLAVPGAVWFLRRHGRHAVLFTVFPVLFILLYSMKLVWHGGAWGPRYLLPIIPLLALTVAPVVEWLLAHGRWARLALAGVAALSVVVQLLGIAKDPETFPAMVREHVLPGLPELGSFLGGRDYFLARGGDELARALQDPTTPGATHRGIGYLWGYPDAWLDITVSTPRVFDLSLYFVDWDHQQRRQTVRIDDALGTRTWEMDQDFSGGVWATWQVVAAPNHPVRVSLTQRGPDTAVLSAAAFEASQHARTDLPALDTTTRGDWLGHYGQDGYDLFAWRSFNVDLAQLPPYVSQVNVDHIGDKPDPRIHVETAEQDVLDTALLYAAPFSPLLGNAWLLGADLVKLIRPARPDLVQGVLLRPPWTWFRLHAPTIPHPEYGLGLDFWPTVLYTNYASHPGVLAVMWTTLALLESALLWSGGALLRRTLPASPGRTRVMVAALGALGVALLLFDWLQVQG